MRDTETDLRDRVRAINILTRVAADFADHDTLREVSREELDWMFADVIELAEGARQLLGPQLAGEEPPPSHEVRGEPYRHYAPGELDEGLLRNLSSSLAGVGAVASELLGRRYEERFGDG